MYGKLVKGVKRTTYLIGPNQRLIHIFEEVKPEGHAEESPLPSLRNPPPSTDA